VNAGWNSGYPYNGNGENVDNADDVYWGAFGNVCSVGSSGAAKRDADARKMQALQDSCCDSWLIAQCHYNATILQDSKAELQQKVLRAQALKNQVDAVNARVEQLNAYLVAKRIYIKDVAVCNEGTTSTSTASTTTTTTTKATTKAPATTTVKSAASGATVSASPAARSSTKGSSAALNIGMVVGLVVGAAVVAGVAAVAVGFFASASVATTPTAFTHSLMAGAQSSPLYESLSAGAENAMF